MSEKCFIVGKRLPRADAIEKVKGEAEYTSDMQLPGMLYAKFLRSPYAHARIIDIDTTKAEALPGVKAVLTGHCGPKAFKALQIAGVQIYLGIQAETVKEAIEKFKKGELRIANSSDVGDYW